MRYYFCVKGKVQGVGFRYFVRQQANALGLSGWVRNCMNQDVEGEIQGAADSAQQFFDRLRTGPAFSKVSSLQTQEIKEQDHESSFEIRY